VSTRASLDTDSLPSWLSDLLNVDIVALVDLSQVVVLLNVVNIFVLGLTFIDSVQIPLSLTFVVVDSFLKGTSDNILEVFSFSNSRVIDINTLWQAASHQLVDVLSFLGRDWLVNLFVVVRMDPCPTWDRWVLTSWVSLSISLDPDLVLVSDVSPFLLRATVLDVLDPVVAVTGELNFCVFRDNSWLKWLADNLTWLGAWSMPPVTTLELRSVSDSSSTLQDSLSSQWITLKKTLVDLVESLSLWLDILVRSGTVSSIGLQRSFLFINTLLLEFLEVSMVWWVVLDLLPSLASTSESPPVLLPFSFSEALVLPLHLTESRNLLKSSSSFLAPLNMLVQSSLRSDDAWMVSNWGKSVGLLTVILQSGSDSTMSLSDALVELNVVFVLQQFWPFLIALSQFSGDLSIFSFFTHGFNLLLRESWVVTWFPSSLTGLVIKGSLDGSLGLTQTSVVSKSILWMGDTTSFATSTFLDFLLSESSEISVSLSVAKYLDVCRIDRSILIYELELE
jgi:hypothetical protein